MFPAIEYYCVWRHMPNWTCWWSAKEYLIKRESKSFEEWYCKKIRLNNHTPLSWLLCYFLLCVSPHIQWWLKVMLEIELMKGVFKTISGLIDFLFVQKFNRLWWRESLKKITSQAKISLKQNCYYFKRILKQIKWEKLES